MHERDRQFEPDLGIKGPYPAPVPRLQRLWQWLRGFTVTFALVWASSFICGALLRHFGLI